MASDVIVPPPHIVVLKHSDDVRERERNKRLLNQENLYYYVEKVL
jgi:hypothetical protein